MGRELWGGVMNGYSSSIVPRTDRPSRREPGDLRWPARHVALLIGGYLGMIWTGLLLLGRAVLE